PPLTPKVPLSVDVHLAPADQVRHTGIHNSGGITRHRDVTIVGRTTPGSIVFTDGPKADFSFTGLPLPTDANGAFTYTLHLTDLLTNTEYVVFDPFGQQKVRSFPIRLLG